MAAVERLVERMGGAEVWSRARSLYVEYRGWRTAPDEPMIERAWRDLVSFDSWVEFQGRSFHRVRVTTAERTWESRDGEVTVLPDALHRAFLRFRPGDNYTMIRRFAVGDPDLRLDFEEPRRVVVRSSTGDGLGWWEIDDTGQLVRWGHEFDGRPLEYLYLPLRPFGLVEFPAGGTASDGSWRFTYEVVELREGPIPVSLDPPTSP